MYRWRGFVLAILLAVQLAVPKAHAMETSAASAILVDADSGRVLYEHHADNRMLIASTTKIMTALAAIRSCGMQEMVTVSREAASTEGSSMYLKEGEQLTMEALLYGLMLSSGNDAAVAIAQHTAGSVEAFVAEMNRLARDFGMENTSFANPNGLDHEAHYSTARDMALLARKAVEDETLVRIASTERVTIQGRTMQNHNKLLGLVEGCIGLKTGYTRAAGRTLVSCAERQGQRLIAVTLQDGNDWADHEMLYDEGFQTYPRRRLASVGDVLGSIPVQGGGAVSAAVTAAAPFFYPLKEIEKVRTELELLPDLEAPITAGMPAGEAVFLLNGEEIGRIPLVCGEHVPPKLRSAMGTLRLGLPEYDET